jgi:hypothetical protein
MDINPALTTQRYAHLSQDTLIDAAIVVPFTMSVPIAAVAPNAIGPMLGM